MEKIKIGFICVHNSCRSIIAEGICRDRYSDIFDVYSGGTQEYDAPKPDALRTLKRKYDIDSEGFSSKLIETLPELDIVITMGCNVDCPHLPSKYREDFGLDDPSGMDDMIFDLTADIIELKLEILVRKIKAGEITL